MKLTAFIGACRYCGKMLKLKEGKVPRHAQKMPGLNFKRQVCLGSLKAPRE